MAKLYYTSDIAAIFDEKINELAMETIGDENASDEELVKLIHEIRLYKDFAFDIISDMRDADRKEEEERAAWEAEKRKKEQQEAQNGSAS